MRLCTKLCFHNFGGNFVLKIRFFLSSSSLQSFLQPPPMFKKFRNNLTSMARSTLCRWPLKCDQMARLFFNIWHITKLKIWPNSKINFSVKVGSKFFQMLNETLKIAKLWNFAKSGHTDWPKKYLILYFCVGSGSRRRSIYTYWEISSENIDTEEPLKVYSTKPALTTRIK